MTRNTLAMLVALFALASSAKAAVTHITSVANDTDDVVEIRNFENPDKKGHNDSVPAGMTHGIENIDAWIPWADNPKHLEEGKYIRIKFMQTQKDGTKSPITLYIWQSKGSVRYSKMLAYDKDAPAVPGVGTEGGRRKVVVRKDGTFEFCKTE